MLKPAVVFHLALFAWDGYLSALVDSGFGHGAIVFSQGFVLVAWPLLGRELLSGAVSVVYGLRSKPVSI